MIPPTGDRFNIRYLSLGLFLLWVVLLGGCPTVQVVETRSLNLMEEVDYGENGTIQTRYTYYLRDGSRVLHGTLRSYTRGGELYLKEQYVHGSLDGERILYDENARKKLIENYQDGQLHGTTTVYEFGRKVREAEFVQGVLRGVTRWDGTGRVRVRFKNDSEGRIVQGVSYDATGQVTGRVEEGDGRLVIPIGDQEVKVTVTFENGMKVSEELVGETGEDFDFADSVTPFLNS